MRIKSTILGIIIMAVVVAVAGCGRSGGSAPSKPYTTCNMMLNVARTCDAFKNARGAWPNSLEEINSFLEDLVHKDAWGHDLAFTPYDAAKGYGEITSYGRDGKPGGTGEDADIVIRFPVKANADWNRQQAMNIKVPPQAPSDWYEFYLN